MTKDCKVTPQQKEQMRSLLLQIKNPEQVLTAPDLTASKFVYWLQSDGTYTTNRYRQDRDR